MGSLDLGGYFKTRLGPGGHCRPLIGMYVFHSSDLKANRDLPELHDGNLQPPSPPSPPPPSKYHRTTKIFGDDNYFVQAEGRRSLLQLPSEVDCLISNFSFFEKKTIENKYIIGVWERKANEGK